ncbi:MAG TPA: PAS domain S-box protein, partial [Thermoanaerobaculaceae bacterium]|nr:PAS domain S-box protein [Thermoanaerobaculaceae bacterium]
MVALLGWLKGSLAWAGAVASYVPMAPATALSTVALAGAVAARVRESSSRRARLAAAAVCALVGLQAAGVLAQLAAGVDLGFDRVFAPAAAAQSAMAGRMSPVTAALFVGFALALLFELVAGEKPRVRDVVTITAGLVLAGATAIAISYALGAPFLYTGGVVPVALPTALAAASLAAALLATRQRRAWGAKAYLAIALVIVVGVAVTLACYGVISTLERERAHAAFVRRASTLSTAVERSMVENLDEVRDVAARFADQAAADPAALRRFLVDRAGTHSAILALGWAPRVEASGVRALEESARHHGEPAFRVHAAGGAALTGTVDRYPLRFVAGPAAGPALEGLDLASEAALRELLEAAERSGELAASGEVRPLGTGIAAPTVWAAVPVIGPASGGAAGVVGFAVGVFSLPRMLAASLAGLNQGGVALSLAANPAEGAPAGGGADSGAEWTRSFTFGGRSFQLRASSGPSSSSEGRDWLAEVVLGGGLLLTMLLGLYLMAGARHAEEVSRIVEELRQSERRASESSSLLEQVLAALPVPVFLKRRDATYELCNAEMGRWFGHSPDEIRGRRSDELYPPGEAEQLQAMDAELLDLPGSRTLSMPITRADGETRETTVHKASVLDARGRVRGVVGVMFDVTERTRAEALQAALLELSEAAHTSTGLADLLPRVHRVIARLMPAGNCYVALLEPASGQLTFPYFVDEEDVSPPAPRRPGRGLTEYVLRTGSPALVSPKRFAELVAAGEVETLGAPSIDWLGVPLVIDGASRGVLAVQTYTEGVRYGDRERDLLTVVARSISEAIERTRAAAALRESEERFRSLAASASDAILTADSRGTIVYANPAAAAAFGYPEGMAGQPIDLIVPPRFRGQHWAGFSRAAAKGTSRIAGQAVELVAQRRDGSEFPVELSLATWRAQGQVFFTAIVRDVSERKKVEEQLLRAQRMEAVGRLAGGAAHDLNNAMQSMLASVALARAGAAEPAALERALAALTDEIGRAAATTRQLLLFSQREVTKFEPLDLAEVVRA